MAKKKKPVKLSYNHRRLKRFAAEQDNECYWCNSPLLFKWEIPTHISWKQFPNVASFEHLTPASHGGTFERSNIAIACKDCNALRATIHHDAFKWVSSDPVRYAKFKALKKAKKHAADIVRGEKKKIGVMKGVIMAATMLYMLNLYNQNIFLDN